MVDVTPPTNGAVLRELERRMDKIESRMDYIDEHGTRAVNTISFQIAEASKNIARVEGMVKGLSDTFDRMTGIKWQQILTLCVAILPLYILTITILINHTH